MREPPIHEIVEKIVQTFHPRRILLFGSRARGEAGTDSDADIFVEMETDLPPRQRRLAIAKLFRRRDWPMDIVVYTPREVQELKDIVGTLLYTIVREGRLLYEAA